MALAMKGHDYRVTSTRTSKELLFTCRNCGHLLGVSVNTKEYPRAIIELDGTVKIPSLDDYVDDCTAIGDPIPNSSIDSVFVKSIEKVSL